MENVDTRLTIEVAFATEHKQLIIPLSVSATCCIEEAIQHSGILRHFPEIDLTKNKVGIFGKLRALNTLVQAGDRIEIYRALSVDPKKTRINRAKKQKASL
ncbi:RnfH family protein [Rickettsiella endosymbiont of Dermanyssus gallinae]|uniref:RnfH family protein n=1 Tax=Rickettsiella endosymbiont of Dermanyssus gallinae TaxID=2856608 RepID=UPI001C52F286|nr:RnfH family protein [Rickettsiella endosymbiont of Dermanyssus gallinae]